MVAVQAHLLLRRPEGQALGVPGDEEARDATSPVVRGAHERRVVVGMAAVADPGLRAVERVGVPVQRRLGRHRRGVRAGVGLGQAVRAEQVTAEHVGQEALLLLGRAELDERESGQPVDADTHPDAGPAGGDHLEDLQVHLVRLAAAAQLLGVRQAQQPRPSEQGEDVAGEPLVRLVLRGARGQLLVRDLGGQGQQVLGLGGGQDALDLHGVLQGHRDVDAAA